MKVALASVASFVGIKDAAGVLAAVVNDVAADDVLFAGVPIAGVTVLAPAVVRHADLVEVAGGVDVAILLDVAAGV